MTLIQIVPEILRRLPARVRSAIYTALLILGGVLALATSMGWEDLGPLTTGRALEIYAFISPLVGGVAVANVGQSAAAAGLPADSLAFEEESADLSSFEPVADDTSVFGLSPA